MTERRAVGFASLAGMLLCIVGANWAIQHFGIVPVGFGLMAPAGVYFAGLVFVFRDVLQNTIGRKWSLVAIVAGALFSFAVAPSFAFASGVTFLFAETADFLVYTPLYKRNWLAAAIPANIAGLIVDSLLFLWLAFGSEASVWGLVFGKACMTAVAVLLLLPVRKRYALKPA